MNTYFKRKVVLCGIVWICSTMLYSQQRDTLSIRRGENGKIKFARFAIEESSDRKMNNDTIFLKSILQAKDGVISQ